MEIEVYFESRQKFDTRVNKIEKKSFLREAIDNVTDVFNNDKMINETLIITLEDCSSFNPHVLEIMLDIFDYLEDKKKVNKVLVNNPSKSLYKKLKARGISEEYTSNFKKISEKEIKKVKNTFDKKIIGQNIAKNTICRKLVTQLIRPSLKPLVLMFYGNPGLGKTETAKFLGQIIDNNDEILREQMSMVGGEASIKYFKATSHNENSFSKTLMNRNSNIILLDEFALAPEFIKSSFFQMFDEGYYSDQNFDVDVRNSIIICTSNLLSKKDMYQNFDSALLSRIDGFVEFKDFSIEEKKLLANNILKEILNKNNMTKKYRDLVNEKNIQHKINNVLTDMTNARNIRTYVEDLIADELLKNLE